MNALYREPYIHLYIVSFCSYITTAISFDISLKFNSLNIFNESFFDFKSAAGHRTCHVADAQRLKRQIVFASASEMPSANNI
jgi:hypothetical protein